jgi:hypothetical protein
MEGMKHVDMRRLDVSGKARELCEQYKLFSVLSVCAESWKSYVVQETVSAYGHLHLLSQSLLGSPLLQYIQAAHPFTTLQLPRFDPCIPNTTLTLTVTTI